MKYKKKKRKEGRCRKYLLGCVVITVLLLERDTMTKATREINYLIVRLLTISEG